MKQDISLSGVRVHKRCACAGRRMANKLGIILLLLSFFFLPLTILPEWICLQKKDLAQTNGGVPLTPQIVIFWRTAGM